jgi:hypothetical protein
MGYYSAGGPVSGGLVPSHRQDLVPVSASNQTPPSDEAPRRKTQVINLTALRRAFRRVDRATRVAHKLFSMKKQGVHGLKFKRHRRKKGI